MKRKYSTVQPFNFSSNKPSSLMRSCCNFIHINNVCSVSLIATCLLLPVKSFASGGPSDFECVIRNNNTANKLVECIHKDSLWLSMKIFQAISNANPDHTFDGFPGAPHGSRDAGTPGDKASVNYIANVMKLAGYKVTIQSYPVAYSVDKIIPSLQIVSPLPVTSYAPGSDFSTALYAASGDVTAQIQAIPGIIDGTPSTAPSTSGCSAADFSSFVPGRIALMERGGCTNRAKVLNAIAAGAVGAITFNYDDSNTSNTLISADGMTVPVFAYIPYHVGIGLYHKALQGPVSVHLKLNAINETRTTYNVIADSKFGDPNHVVVVDAHYDSIFGAGMLDNASGSATILEIALKMRNTPTRNKLRYIWFGGEELGLYGSDYYTSNLTDDELSKIVFDVDADVTASQNYTISIATPANSSNVAFFPPNVVPASELGNNYFRQYFDSIGSPHHDASFGNNGTDSLSFSYVGVPNTGILTGQDCCKTQELVDLFGGYLGNFEGNISRGIPLNVNPPNFDGGCVDNPYVFCDNLNNNDPKILELISKATRYVVHKLANDVSLNPHPTAGH